MKASDFYMNRYPLEELLIEPSEEEICEEVYFCDYTIEADRIAEDIGGDTVNMADAVVFFKMGFKAAVEQIEHKLVPVVDPRVDSLGQKKEQ